MVNERNPDTTQNRPRLRLGRVDNRVEATKHKAHEPIYVLPKQIGSDQVGVGGVMKMEANLREYIPIFLPRW